MTLEYSSQTATSPSSAGVLQHSQMSFLFEGLEYQ